MPPGDVDPVACEDQSFDMLAIFGPQLDLVKVAKVGIERIVGRLV
jgi:hypothetical protein